jgi:hypothetical protein
MHDIRIFKNSVLFYMLNDHLEIVPIPVVKLSYLRRLLNLIDDATKDGSVEALSYLTQ